MEHPETAAPDEAPAPELDATQLEERAQGLPLGTLDKLRVSRPLTEDVQVPQIGMTIRVRGATWGEIDGLDGATREDVARATLRLCIIAPPLAELPQDEADAWLMSLPFGVALELNNLVEELSGLRGEYVRSSARGFPA